VFRDGPPGTLVYTRGRHLVALNLSAEPAPAPPTGRVVLATGEVAAGTVLPHSGFVAVV